MDFKLSDSKITVATTDALKNVSLIKTTSVVENVKLIDKQARLAQLDQDIIALNTARTSLVAEIASMQTVLDTVSVVAIKL